MGTPIESSPTGDIGTSSDSGPNPAWNDVLSIIPEQFHQQITPHFQKWDSAANTKISDLNSKVKDFEPYSALVEHGINMSQIEQALLLAQEINTNPRAIYDALVSAYNFGTAPNTEKTEGTSEGQQQTPDPYAEKYSNLEQQLGLVSQILLQENEAKEAARYDAWLDKELGSALMKFPDLQLDENSEKYILAQMWQNGGDANAAVQSFVDFRNTLAPQPFAPRVMGSNGGGGYPSQAIDPTKLSPKDTRSLVAQMLAAAAQQN